MKHRLIVALVALMLAKPAFAFLPWMAMGIAWATEYIGIPVSYALGCAFAYSPPLRVFGTEENVYGLDWGSMACHARNVYGLQLGFCGCAVERRLWGLQLGILAAGYASEELPFDGYHFFNLDFCRMNGIEFGTLAAKTAMVNGLQLSAVYTEAEEVNGLQVGLVNTTDRLHGIQVGLFNSASQGFGLQVGLLNRVKESGLEFLPVVNLAY